MPASSHSLPANRQITPILNGSESIGWHNAAFFVPFELADWKRKTIFDPIAERAALVVYGNGRTDAEMLAALPRELVPIIGCTIAIRDLVREWIETGRRFVYWDRGYLCRGGLTWLPNRRRSKSFDHFRWQLNGFQMPTQGPVNWHRLASLNIKPHPWRKDGRKVVVAAQSDIYNRFNRTEAWLDETLDQLRGCGREIVVRHKTSRVPLLQELQGAHCLVTHGSIAAVEAVVMGYPVFVDQCSAAALVGRTDLDIENPVTPERRHWMGRLAASQFTLSEILNGECWK